MKTLILAAGRGSRMGELAAHRSKPMLLLHGRPLLEHLLRALATAGFREVVVAVGYLADQIINYFGDGHDLGVSISYRRVEGVPPETFVLAERNRLRPDESLLCLTGDSLISAAQIRVMLDLFESSQADAVVTVELGGESDLRVAVEANRVTGSSCSLSDPLLAYNMVMRGAFLKDLARWSAERAGLAFAQAMKDFAPRHVVLVADIGRVPNLNRAEDLATEEVRHHLLDDARHNMFPQGRVWGFPSAEANRFPNIVNVEVFRGACPCRCRHCPVGLTAPEERTARFGVRGIDLPLWDRITQEVALHPWATVRIHSVGDPVLWDGLAEALDIVRRSKVRCWVFTSAITTDLAVLDALMQCASVVEVSVNSTNREDYQATKGVDAFALASTNLEHLSSWRQRGPAARLIVSRTQSPDEVADAEFVRFWRESGLVDDAFVRSFHSYNGILSAGPCSPGEAKHEPCLVHWARFNISVEGKAVVCFNELFSEHLDPRLVLGDVQHERIADIWRGPLLAALRKAELAGDYRALPFGGSLPCSHCTSYQPLSGPRQTSEHQIEQLRPPQ